MVNIILSSVTVANTGSVQFMKAALIVLALILAALVLSSIIFTILSIKSRPLSTARKILLSMVYIATAVVLVCTALCFYRYTAENDALLNAPSTSAPSTSATQPTTEPTTEATTEATTVPPTDPEPTYEAGYADFSDPKNWNVKWEILQNDKVVDSYTAAEPVTFGDGSQYSTLDGVISFRGDNYRSGATFGTADVVSQTLVNKWEAKIGSLGKWTGCGWTGQPLIVRWDDETKAIMNLYPDKKAKADLVEVIYATLDGNVYFYDLDDGSYTRDPVYLGMSFKGAGSLDPRGYPLMYVGSGDNYNGSAPKMYIISLVEGKIIYEQNGRDSIAKRKWYAFDSAPLVDAETDTLIWPGESGVLYSIKLNTNYDKTAGTLTVSPENTVKTRYTTNTGHKIGCESSAIIVGSYLYFADNGGMFFCVDLNTMDLVWAQNTHDDVNATPVFEWGDDGRGYIYTGTSMEYGKGTTYLHKLDAATGEIIWEKKYGNVAYDSAVSGGVLSSPLLGKKGTDLEGLIIFSIARTPTPGGGTLVALDTETGEVVWENTLRNYCWSSPVAVYTDEGKAYFVLCDSAGKATLYEGATGTAQGSVSLGSNVEASPAVFGDTLVVGTRGQKILALKIE